MEKLKEEINKATEPYAQAVGKFVLSLNLATVPAGKTLKGCMDAIKEKAKKQAKGGVAVIEDHMVYGWAAEYFGLAPAAAKKETAKVQTPATSNVMPLDLDFEDLL